ncbi:ISAHY-like protein [Mya arenaria]|uniref:ISAHY-like protein n=1 Tax=Mya arenaria TaxID=6604 RepID=A0ABY7DHQ1_MYAAR|nr:ISAHY-like protein [Mya arenaria]
MLGITFISLCVTLALGRRVVDLTHTFDQNAPKYPLEQWVDKGLDWNMFRMTTLMAKLTLKVTEYYEHQGTHMDAPMHSARGGEDMASISPERLVGPGIVIDVTDKAESDVNYAVTVEDLKKYEADHGRIPPGAIIMMNSGWARKYPDSNKVFGSQNLSDPLSFRFPGFSLEACNVVGVDTPSVDPGIAPEYYCHNHLQPSGVPLLEYVANLDAIPVRGSTIVLGAIKMREGTGGPTRIFALLDDENDGFINGANSVSSRGAIGLLSLSTLWISNVTTLEIK